MTEKEERISVIIYEKDPCENCQGNPMTDCQICEKDLRYDGGVSRQDAINRMAKAIKENEGEGPKDLAEAALNALLGGK